MAYILILLFIPIFFVGAVVYVSTLYTFMTTNELDMVLLMIGLFSGLISSFVINKSISLIEIKDYYIIKFKRFNNSLIGLVSFLFLLLFGIALVVNSSLLTFNITKLFVGIAIILFYIYVFYFYVFKKKIFVYKLKDITKITDKLYLYKFEDKEKVEKDYYFKTKEKYKKNKSYKVSYSIVNDNICKILSEVNEE